MGQEGSQENQKVGQDCVGVFETQNFRLLQRKREPERGGQGPWAEGQRVEGQGPTNVAQVPFASLDGDVSHLRIRAASWRKPN